MNEDALLVAPPRIGVFDGATALAGSAAGGAEAARLACACFARGGGLAEAARAANRAIAEAIAAAGIAAPSPVERWSTTAAVVDLGGDAFEWFTIGDSAVVVERDDGVEVHTEPDHDVETRRQWAALVAQGCADPRARLAAELARVRALANVAWGALNGDPRAEAHFRRGVGSLAGVRRVLLLTDGAFPPGEGVEGGCDGPAVVAAARGGVGALHAHVRALERSDSPSQRLPVCNALFPGLRLRWESDCAGRTGRRGSMSARIEERSGHLARGGRMGASYGVVSFLH